HWHGGEIHSCETAVGSCISCTTPVFKERLCQNILACPHLQIHLKNPVFWDNADLSNARILPAEFFTSRTTSLYQE
ncbi:unnamed protein product, partial [Bubo scandiacus]